MGGSVSFDTVAREWRCRYTGPAPDSDSLEACQKVLDEVLPTLKGLEGVKSVQRVVCGACLDFKIITALEAPGHDKWAAAEYGPEKETIEKLTAIAGVSVVE